MAGVFVGVSAGDLSPNVVEVCLLVWLKIWYNMWCSMSAIGATKKDQTTGRGIRLHTPGGRSVSFSR